VNKQRLAFWTVLVVLCGLAACALYSSSLMRGVRVLGGVRSRVVLGPAEFARLPRERFDQLAVTEAGTLLLRSDHHLYEAAPVKGGFDVVVVAPNVSSFVSMGSNLLVLRGDRLGEVTPRGLRDVLRLPTAGMRLARCGPGNELCVWKKDDTHLLRLDPHGRLTSWLTLIEPVVGVAPTRGGAVYVATRGVVYRVLGTQSNVAIRPPPELGALVSVASDPATGELFFATRDRVYAMRGAQAVALTRGLGGVLCSVASTLYVFDEARSVILGLETAGRR
jgi:hypothetical protein